MKRLPIMITGVCLLAVASGTPSSGSLGPALRGRANRRCFQKR